MRIWYDKLNVYGIYSCSFEYVANNYIYAYSRSYSW